jgi:predicted transcriptional regulator
MAREATNLVALLSIKPNFVTSILKGLKRVEFRKGKFGKPVEHVIVYSSNPEQKIVGYFDILMIDEDKPIHLWKKYANISGITLDEFESYYIDKKIGTAILINNFYTLIEPIPLSKLRGDITPPQNYSYLSQKELIKLKQCPF